MMKAVNLINRSRLKATVWTGVLFLVIGHGLWFYANSVIQGHEQLLKNPNLTPEETWRCEGSLQWWKRAYTTTFYPLAVILPAMGLVTTLCPIPLAAIQKRRALKSFTSDVIRGSKEKAGRRARARALI